MQVASRNVSVHAMSIYVIHGTNHASPAVHIVYIYNITMTNKSAMSQIYQFVFTLHLLRFREMRLFKCRSVT